MTPRLPLVAAALAAAALASPSSAGAPAGVWTSGYGFYSDRYASIEGSVTWADTTTSWCTGGHINGRGSLSCTGGVTFDADCTGVGAWVAITLECVDHARHVVATADVAFATYGGPFTGTITYALLPA